MDVITSHLNADFDAMAAMVAAKKIYPDAEMVFSGSQEKNLREFFTQSSQYQFEFKRLRQIPLAEVSRLIIVDTRLAGRLGNFAGCLDNPGIKLHIYDHHPELPGDLKRAKKRDECRKSAEKPPKPARPGLRQFHRSGRGTQLAQREIPIALLGTQLTQRTSAKLEPFLSAARTWEASIGVSVNATMTETNTAAVTATPNS